MGNNGRQKLNGNEAQQFLGQLTGDDGVPNGEISIAV